MTGSDVRLTTRFSHLVLTHVVRQWQMKESGPVTGSDVRLTKWFRSSDRLGKKFVFAGAASKAINHNNTMKILCFASSIVLYVC